MTRTTCDLCGKEIGYREERVITVRGEVVDRMIAPYLYASCDKCLSDINNAEENGTMKVEILKAVTQFCTNVPKCTPSNEAILEQASIFDLWTALSMKKGVEVTEAIPGPNGIATIIINIFPQEENE
jgi:hypothetical protein